jgi:peptidoglycan/LPS O-acetylase OafA/YrhL
VPDHPAAAPSARLAFADGLRGLAALWVLLFHLSTGHHVDALLAALPAGVDRVVFTWGHGGVAVFFVLSGCVLALTAERAVLDPAGAGRFVLRRLLRLAPPYYAALLVAVLLALAKGEAFGLDQLLAHVLFAQTLADVPPVGIVFWTLSIELQFYLAFALLTALADAGGAARADRLRTATRRLVAVLALAWPLGWLATPTPATGFLPFWGQFMAGVLVRDAMRQGRGAALFATVFAAVLLACGVARDDLFSGIAGATALALLAAHAAGGLHTWLSGRAAQALGRVSYSLYLMHVPTITVAAAVLRRLPAHGGVGGELLDAAALLAACLAVAWAFWRAIERPSIRWSHRLSLLRTVTPLA